MTAQPQTRSQNSTVRCRAAKACRRCNEKRVKCDALERGTPCTRCAQRNEVDCVLIQSRRGIYTRKPRTHQQQSSRRSRSESRETSCESERQTVPPQNPVDGSTITIQPPDTDTAPS